MLKEFREFIARGNVIDLAVGVIIGAAFSKIITSLVDDIILPPLGLLLGKVDFTNLFLSLRGGEYATLAAAKAAGVPTLNYGLFINAFIHFLIVAFAIFFVVRMVNRLKRRPEELPPTLKSCPFCLTAVPAAATRCAACTSEISAV